MYANYTEVEVDGKPVGSYECVLACESKLVYQNKSDGWSCWNHITCEGLFPFLNEITVGGQKVF